MAGRVIPTAIAIGASWYDPPPMPSSQYLSSNIQWINDAMDRGAIILDLGPAPGKLYFPGTTSKYYQAEPEQIRARNYPAYVKFQVPGE